MSGPLVAKGGNQAVWGRLIHQTGAQIPAALQQMIDTEWRKMGAAARAPYQSQFAVYALRRAVQEAESVVRLRGEEAIAE